MKCNLCQDELNVSPKSLTLMQHIKDHHKDIFSLHKDNPEASGYRVEFFHLNVLKDDGEVDPKTQPIILGEMCEATTEPDSELLETTEEHEEPDVINMQYVMLHDKRKYKRAAGHEQRKRSWIWKYFERLSNIVFRCAICSVVLSTKGQNTNNLNRHMRSKHPDTFRREKQKLLGRNTTIEFSSEIDTPYAISSEDIDSSNKELSESSSPKSKRSWVWSYFEHVTSTQAKCKLCQRHINHGGNATGNMNRHLKKIHHTTHVEMIRETDWVWKVVEREINFYICKICQLHISKKNSDTDMNAILGHLKREHRVISGDQIITGTECLDREEILE